MSTLLNHKTRVALFPLFPTLPHLKSKEVEYEGKKVLQASCLRETGRAGLGVEEEMIV